MLSSIPSSPPHFSFCKPGKQLDIRNLFNSHITVVFHTAAERSTDGIFVYICKYVSTFQICKLFLQLFRVGENDPIYSMNCRNSSRSFPCFLLTCFCSSPRLSHMEATILETSPNVAFGFCPLIAACVSLKNKA